MCSSSLIKSSCHALHSLLKFLVLFSSASPVSLPVTFLNPSFSMGFPGRNDTLLYDSYHQLGESFTTRASSHYLTAVILRSGPIRTPNTQAYWTSHLLPSLISPSNPALSKGRRAETLRWEAESWRDGLLSCLLTDSLRSWKQGTFPWRWGWRTLRYSADR